MFVENKNLIFVSLKLSISSAHYNSKRLINCWFSPSKAFETLMLFLFSSHLILIRWRSESKIQHTTVQHFERLHKFTSRNVFNNFLKSSVEHVLLIMQSHRNAKHVNSSTWISHKVMCSCWNAGVRAEIPGDY